ncbi:MAG TPA: hypothetical protein PLF22_08395 [Pseudomonadales bacterium]|nr:hypothetical protein [Pseudomonadales bacterium]
MKFSIRTACILSLVVLAGCATSSQSTQIRSERSSQRPAPIQEIHQPAIQPAAIPGTPPTRIEPHTSTNSGVAGLLQQAAQARAAGDFARAQTLAERAQGLEPRQAHSYLELSKIYRDRGDNARSRQMALRGLQYADDDPALQDELHLLSAQ